MKKFFTGIIILITFSILGFIITLQLRNVQDDYTFVSLKTISDLQSQLEGEKKEIENLKELADASRTRLQEYSEALKTEGSIRDVLANDLKNMKMLSGHIDLEGPGIIVKLSDSERELYEGENPNNLVVHESDVLIIVNDLKVAGAEAISINGQRVVHLSEIKCAGPTITINNHTYGQPFIIKAIGDPITLDAAIKSPDSFSTLLKEWGLIVETETSPWVFISKYQGEIALKFATPKEGE
ncbi:DUF881 domain-containing protein [Alkaliphilus serpentinus]|uniref:DUF881 domain-containing protein n=1 Tax=Alkaliphilus serpentinus TaxID=1482731 RepID=A0A833HRC0_9FIRM|nr:DUF881 domain-containing protein [Alkaliphilus serpentinus]KAB3533183.1 DUF881 domain-containing protein [Alkaliphilus serpentinus]